MALIRDYEIQDVGVVVPNAYHVITHMDVEKRNTASVKPVEHYDVNKPNPDDEWEVGHYGRIVVQVWKDDTSKAEGKLPVGNINYSYNVNPVFKINVESKDSYLTQAYNHLKLTDYYMNSTEV